MKPFLSWRQLWLIEAVRLKESQWGPIEDAVEVRRVRAAGGTLDERVLRRAELLAEREGWVSMQQRLVHLGRLSLGALMLLFVVLGAGVGIGALKAAEGRVNILFALVALLAVPTMSLLFWCGAFLMSAGSNAQPGFGLSRFWIWLCKRWVKGPDASLLITALIGFSSRQKLSRWALSAINHILWLLALSAAVVSVLALLAAKRYYFSWETTLLSADTFVKLVQGLGVLPGFIGFVTPSEFLIRQSDGLQWVALSAQVQWSSWLVGCVIVYGVLPRLLALIWCGLAYNKHYAQRHIEHQLQGLIELDERLMPKNEYVGIDAGAGADQVPVAEVKPIRPASTVSTLCVGIELAADQSWPPVVWPENWQDAGLVDSRDQRSQLLARLATHSFEHLVLCVDAEQTPDRGVVAWLAELATYSAYCTIYVINANRAAALTTTPSTEGRLEAWQYRLDQAGFKAVYVDFDLLLQDLI